MSSPESYLGVYKTLEDVPPWDRLEDRSPQELPHDDPFTAFIEHRDDQIGWNSWDKYLRARDKWQEFMGDRGRHYALADPQHVEDYIDQLRHGGPRDGRTWRTVYANYMAPLNGFFEWMMYHPDYPHVYSPVYMAAAQDGMAREAWYGASTR